MGSEYQKCKGIKADGTPCNGPAVAGFDYCQHHLEGGPPATIRTYGVSGENNKGIRSPFTKYGEYIRELITPEEIAVFEQFWNALHEEFELNESVDKMNAANAVIMQIQLNRAIKSGNVEAQRHFETMLRNQLNMLKVSRLAREGSSNTLHVTTMTPAEWAAKMIKEGQQLIDNKKARYHVLPDVEVISIEDEDSENEGD